MQVRETSLDAFRTLQHSDGLQRREREVLTAVYAHFMGRDFTRKELARVMGWEINRITGRVLRLIEKGELVETSARRDGGYLLTVAPRQAALFS